MVNLDNTLGAFLIGVVISAILYGGVYALVPLHPTRNPSLSHLRSNLVLLPSLSLGPVVAAVLISDSCHQALITHSLYIYLVTDFGVPQDLGMLVWSLVVEVLFNGFTALMVQSFLAMRVYRLSNKSLLATGSVMILVIGNFVLVVVYVARALRFQTFVQLTSLETLSKSVNAVTVASDVLIAALLCLMLQKSRTGFRRSDTMINKLILFSVNTGLLTSVCAVASLVSISLWPDTFIYIGFYFCLGRLYCNSLLATLNARKGLRGDSHNDEMSLSLQGVQHKTTQSMVGTSQKRVPNNISIKIDTTQEYVRDEVGRVPATICTPLNAVVGTVLVVEWGREER
ncbi:hypothetical protein PAXRUDRAFT_8311 [Paxillus rubicundulus Ve08.2h10]|uniref:DUF6534 domain-containing protein n=1 Tax=Paxillus rubicundulus Ve08.2h10 TaxID=930991 RepID=A0A0D0EAF0_9AGAM|nr:hypothetical protein PAXRUDRAFT_8311 [Paxillus rubicundulus Ve08.2h10]